MPWPAPLWAWARSRCPAQTTRGPSSSWAEGWPWLARCLTPTPRPQRWPAWANPARLRDERERAERCFADCEALARQAAIPYPLSPIPWAGRCWAWDALPGRERSRLSRTCFDEALEVARRSGHPYLVGPAVAALGELAHIRHDIPRARALLTEALETARGCSDKATEASALEETPRSPSASVSRAAPWRLTSITPLPSSTSTHDPSSPTQSYVALVERLRSATKKFRR